MADQPRNAAAYYRTGDALRAKHQLAGDAFVQWALRHIADWPHQDILDAGGGWGRFSWVLMDLFGVPVDQIALTDYSVGMLATAQSEAARRDVLLRCSAADIQALPFRRQQFAIVMANFVLYHLTDIQRGVRELARVLKSDGRLLAATHSDQVVVPVIALHYQALDALQIPYAPEEPSPFTMENGEAALRQGFGQVEAYIFEDEQQIYMAAELRATYETMGRYRAVLHRSDVSAGKKRELPVVFEQLAQDIIDAQGVLRAPTRVGVFVCSQPLRA
jgi:ubiquinone/menaquinone biosynthesis C-methylase UbiE